ncbi:Transcription factor, MADS-box [Corchorus capsularis]|uniref:Transcription factor, MADS-box n=1 Tax=Corchorus capsularis TaxID=210143 RepID=A0A1R3GN57_COCAP|nr:Transcription factor, MADS-box [Corchorus capsularis]
MNAGLVKKTKGRQKIEMKLIEKEEDKLITFSKRRSGIYKKACELNTLCGTDTGILVFSPAGKPFSFGHPSFESLANRFLNQSPPPNNNTHPLVEARRKAKVEQLAMQYNEVSDQLDAEKYRGKMIDEMTKGNETQGWWKAPVDQLSEQQELLDLYSNYENVLGIMLSKMNVKGAGDGGIFSSTVASMDPADQHTDVFATNPNVGVLPATFPPGLGPAGCQF